MPDGDLTKLKRCTKCCWEYPATTTFFYKCLTNKDGLDTKCKTCRYKRKSHRTEKICEHCGKKFKINNSRQRFCSGKCRLAHTGIGRFLIFERDDFRCIYCGRSSIEDQSELHLDHIYPASLGGQDVASNIVTACHRCNLEKGDIVIQNIRRIQIEVARRNERNNIDATTKIWMGPRLPRIASDE